MIEKKHGTDFSSYGGALTLDPCYVSDENFSDGMPEKACQKTHKTGWTIKANVKTDYYSWVNEFEASHPVLGRVWGDFEESVYADSEGAFNDFYKNYPPDKWDYGDI